MNMNRQPEKVSMLSNYSLSTNYRIHIRRNNVVQYIDTANGERYLLRVYNNGNKSEKVVYEHEILRQLNQQKLSFQVPATLPALGDGASHKKLSNGAEACIFKIIPGTLAKTTAPAEVGRALGELATAMGKVCSYFVFFFTLFYCFLIYEYVFGINFD